MSAGALIFAYGSNVDHGQMTERCPSARFFSIASLHGYTMCFAGRSSRWGGAVATIRLASNGVVRGVIYRVTMPDLVMLDGFEGAPFVYRRSGVICKTVIGTAHLVMTYALVRGATDLDIPSPEYLAAIRRGYAAWGLDRTAIDRALARSTRH